MAFCRSCGAEVGPETRFCVNCGQKQDAAPSAPGGSEPAERPGRSINVAGENIEHVHHGAGDSPTRQTNVAGRDVVIVQGARDRSRDLNEYKNIYRSMVTSLQVARRTWLNAQERQQLDEAVARLLINSWERETCEREVQGFLGIVVTAQPSELWTIAGGGRQLAHKKPRSEAVESLADYLDEFLPDKLLVWRKDFGAEWRALASETGLLEEVCAKRQERYTLLLRRAVEQNRLPSAAEALERAGRHLPLQALNEALRAVERVVGRTITLPKVPASQPAALAQHKSWTALNGNYEAESNSAVRLEIANGVLQFKLTYPYARSGRASIEKVTLNGAEFSIVLTGHVGSFSSVRGLEGEVTKTGLKVRRLVGNVPKDLSSFETAYVRL